MTPLARLPHAPARAFSTCGRGNARCNCLSGQRRVRMQPPISTCAFALVASQPLPTLTPLPTQQPRQPQQSEASRNRCTLAFARTLTLTRTLTRTRTAIARAPRAPEQNNKPVWSCARRTVRSEPRTRSSTCGTPLFFCSCIPPPLKHCAVGLCDSHLARLSVKAPTVDPNSYQTQPPA
jgi:hypothetical protein